MFTGIIEDIGKVVNLTNKGGNLHISVKSAFTSELKIDQSVSHNGVCLTVTAIEGDVYTVTAIEETLQNTNLGLLTPGDFINLERGMKLGDRLDGHIVQGHIDQTGICAEIKKLNGSSVFTFEHDTSQGNITIEKGSVTVNGVSLTVFNSGENKFSVAIIPYTMEHTTFNLLKKGALVNLEFDVIGKYVKKLANL